MSNIGNAKMLYHQARRKFKLSKNWDDLEESTQALIYYLYNNFACFDALVWVIRNTDKDIYELWETCERGDWLAWLVDKTRNIQYLELFYTIKHEDPTIQEYARKWAAERIKQNYNARYTMILILKHYRNSIYVS